ncbi:MAG: hypothetical protein K6E54_06595, partial [Bacteroidaceae bacterium]|nr:hypothetical protein [Bacteroidaceae bacterium]
MKTKKFLTCVMITCATALALLSCGEEDALIGEWDDMVWKAENPVVQTTSNIYDVSADGTSFTFTCKNYSSAWFEGANEHVNYVSDEHNFPYLIYNENFRAELQGNKLAIDFYANKESIERNTSITVSAGDIFYTFYFRQYPNS